jgi:hypothetical protein
MLTYPRGQSADQVPFQVTQAIAGMPLPSPVTDYGTGLNAKPQSADVWTTTVIGTTSPKTMIVNGSTITYLPDSTPTIDEVVTGLTNAINGDPVAAQVCQAVADLGPNTITMTGWWPGQAFTVTDADAELTTVHTTSSAAAEVIPMGRAVCTDGYMTNGSKRLFNPKTSYFTAQVATLDYTYNAGDLLTVRCANALTGDVIAEYTYTQAGNKGASTTAILAALNGQAPANSVIFSTVAGDNIVATAEVAGLEFSIEIGSSATSAVSNTATTGPSMATSFLRAFVGVTILDQTLAPATLTDASVAYPGNSMVGYLAKGDIWVANSQTPTNGTTVYVECDGTSADCGLLYTTSSATRLPLPLSVARWERAGRTGSGLAVCHLNVR